MSRTYLLIERWWRIDRIDEETITVSDQKEELQFSRKEFLYQGPKLQPGMFIQMTAKARHRRTA